MIFISLSVDTGHVINTVPTFQTGLPPSSEGVWRQVRAFLMPTRALLYVSKLWQHPRKLRKELDAPLTRFSKNFRSPDGNLTQFSG